MISNKPLIVHVGLPKCATTYLKRAYYPLATQNFAHTSKIFSDYFFQDKTSVSCVYDSANGSDPLIVSHEGLCGHFFGIGKAHENINKLKNDFSNIKIIFFIREQFSYLISAYKFCISLGHVMPDLGDFIGAHYDEILSRLCYDELINYYQSLVGDENLLILPYEIFKQSEAAVFKQLNQFINCEVKLVNQAPGNKNQGLYGQKLVKRLQYINPYTLRFRNLEAGLRRRLFKNERSLGGLKEHMLTQNSVIHLLSLLTNDDTDLQVPEDIIGRMSPAIKASNQKVNQQYNLKLKQYGYLLE